MSNKSFVKNRTIFTRDNLEVMRGMADECVDLIYLDPPFNSNHNYAAPIGSKAAGAEFKDTWTLDDIDLAWHGEIESEYPGLYKLLEATKLIHSKSMMAYLIYISVRVMEMRRILKKEGSIYLHCDPTASHYLKLMTDEIFGKRMFRNEIAWCYSTGGRPKRFFAKKHDIIFLYTKTNNAFWGDYRAPVSQEYLDSHYRQRDEQGRRCRIRTDHGKKRVYYPEEGMICNDWWEIPYLNSMSKERTGFPTQKPLKLLERIIEASSSKGDVVLDPFCGCATTCVAAENLDRQWIGMDVSRKAYELVVDRLRDQMKIGTDEKPTTLPYRIVHRTDIPGDRGGTRSRNVKNFLYGEQEGMCRGCGHWYQIKDLEVDHKIPISRGGADVDSNLQLLCGNCNRIKGKGTHEELLAKLRERGIGKY